jgi:hypothetical protein
MTSKLGEYLFDEFKFKLKTGLGNRLTGMRVVNGFYQASPIVTTDWVYRHLRKNLEYELEFDIGSPHALMRTVNL